MTAHSTVQVLLFLNVVCATSTTSQRFGDCSFVVLQNNIKKKCPIWIVIFFIFFI